MDGEIADATTSTWPVMRLEYFGHRQSCLIFEEWLALLLRPAEVARVSVCSREISSMCRSRDDPSCLLLAHLRVKSLEPLARRYAFLRTLDLSRWRLKYNDTCMYGESLELFNWSSAAQVHINEMLQHLSLMPHLYKVVLLRSEDGVDEDDNPFNVPYVLKHSLAPVCQWLSSAISLRELIFREHSWRSWGMQRILPAVLSLVSLQERAGKQLRFRYISLGKIMVGPTKEAWLHTLLHKAAENGVHVQADVLIDDRLDAE
eukprot:gnl/TRDRNA2_/TRDRNA2_122764_c1_seq1.p1 gnl/TRDRNA2_/TRDRNA2_122764_c1~~gnl/TRDRNA2_/TRDRNA2_122764_c1_seq1.p1  ORF type:complete len:260 (-),score=38.20 gnl/TRDRNA2_/TRDRNA2_122764_c1_seq1:58-837(-)